MCSDVKSVSCRGACVFVERQRRIVQIRAWGDALGFVGIQKRASAESATQCIGATHSIPDITLVEIYAVLAQQLAILLLECTSARVFLLAVYVLHNDSI
jgi:hypothetical protein